MPKKHTHEELKESMRQSANQMRDTADEMALIFDGCDDPHHPWMLAEPQIFRDWIDFTEKVCYSLVEADGDNEAEQKAMALYRKVSPYFISVSLVYARNRIKLLEADLEAKHG